MNPILLAAAALIGLPILLHFIMKQEPKRLLFPAFRFLQQKQRSNQSKLRLKHFLLLALRMLLILVFALALFQPKTGERYEFRPLGKPWFGFTLPGSGLGLLTEGPVAAVLILDTSPSMGYLHDQKTRLDEARRRALELLDELPSGSRLAVLDPSDNLPTWEPSVGEARRKIEALAIPSGHGTPLTTALPAAYRLFSTLDKESEGEPLPRLIALFSDRTPESWKADRNAELQKLAEAVPEPKVAHLYFDLGLDQPVNVSIMNAEVRPSLARPGEALTLTVTLQATGQAVPACVVRYAGEGIPGDRREVSLTPGTPRTVSFSLPNNFKPGFYQLTCSLETDDRLSADNQRYVTFQVGAGRKILTICDDPDDAAYWQLSHEKNRTFTVDVLKPEQIRSFNGYEAVCLLSVADPSQEVDGLTLWSRLKTYLDRGGKVVIMPGSSEQTRVAAYDPATSALELLPARLRNVAKRDPAVTWRLDDASLKLSPFLKPFQEWKLRGNVDFLRNPRKVWQLWEVDNFQPENVAVWYDDNPDATKRSPALLEKAFPSGGRLLLLTTRMDSPWDDSRRWHDYWETAESSWAVVFPDLLVKYLLGNSAERSLNFLTGQLISIPLPSGGLGANTSWQFAGPGVLGSDATPKIAEAQAEFRLPYNASITPGHYSLRTSDRSWASSFSLNTPPEEFSLERLPLDTIEAVTGPGSIVSLSKSVAVRDVLQARSNPPLRFFSYLLILLFILFVLESVLANRFDKLRR